MSFGTKDPSIEDLARAVQEAAAHAEAAEAEYVTAQEAERFARLHRDTMQTALATAVSSLNAATAKLLPDKGWR